MTIYIIRRLIQALIVLFIVTALVFILMHLLPGDPILYYLTQDRFTQATPEEIAELRHQFGVDRPIIAQYLDWLNDIFHGDLGRSVSRRVPVNGLIKQALPISFYLGALSFIISNAVAIPIGIISAARRRLGCHGKRRLPVSIIKSDAIYRTWCSYHAGGIRF